MEDATRNLFAAAPIPLRGNDIDTDRIIPARYLTHRRLRRPGRARVRGRSRSTPRRLAEGPHHSTTRASRRRGRGSLLVNKNFGCGSSREHAPQAICAGASRRSSASPSPRSSSATAWPSAFPCVTASEADVAAPDGGGRGRSGARSGRRRRGRRPRPTAPWCCRCGCRPASATSSSRAPGTPPGCCSRRRRRSGRQPPACRTSAGSRRSGSARRMGSAGLQARRRAARAGARCFHTAALRAATGLEARAPLIPQV